MGTHDGHRQRLKTEFLARPDSFPDHKLLELLLFYANPRSDTNPLAHQLIDHFGSLAGVLDASVEELKKVLRKATCECTAIPVCCGSAYRNKGVQKLLDAIVDYMPSPIDIPAIKGINPETEEEEERHSEDDGPFSALAFKIATDPYVGRLSFVRVYSGVLNTGTSVLNSTKKQKERIGRFTRRCIDAFLPQKAASGLARIASMASETFSNFVAGQLADSCILGILCYICMRIFRFPYPEVISVVIGVTSLVPMVGSFIGEVIGALLILIVSPLKALLFVVMVLAIQQVDGAFIYPRIVGRSVGLPGVAVFCAVIVGGNVAGVIGAMIGVPVCALIYALLREAVDARLRRREEKLV